MIYTKQQLKEAYCLATGWTAESGKTKTEWFQERKNELENTLPTVQSEMKQVALNYLAVQSEEDNASVLLD